MDYGAGSGGAGQRGAAFPEVGGAGDGADSILGRCECGQSICFVRKRKRGWKRAEPGGFGTLEIRDDRYWAAAACGKEYFGGDGVALRDASGDCADERTDGISAAWGRRSGERGGYQCELGC